MSPIKKLCDFCGILKSSFRNKNAFREHVRKHQESIHECAQCSKILKSVCALKDHIHDVHGSTYTCFHCEKVFKKKHGLSQHIMENHDQSKAYECDLCDKIFINERSYKHHVEAHSIGETFEHFVCSKKFNTRHSLKNHGMNAHDEENTCNICNKKFTHGQSLQRHEKQCTVTVYCQHLEIVLVFLIKAKGRRSISQIGIHVTTARKFSPLYIQLRADG